MYNFMQNKLNRYSNALWILLCLGLGLFAGFIAIKQTTLALLLITGLMGIILFVGVAIVSKGNSVENSIKILLYLVIITAFFGSAFFSINIGSFHLFPFRIFLLVLWVIFLAFVIINKGILKTSHIKVNYYILFLGTWLFYAVLSLVWSDSLVDAARHIIFLFLGISMIFFVVYYFTKLEDFKRLYYIWVLMLLPMIALGL